MYGGKNIVSEAKFYYGGEMMARFVRVRRGEGLLGQGEVITATNYGTPQDPDWYVEYHDDRDGKYRYVKQKIDRVTVEVFSDGRKK